ncbi:MAG: class I tRNA ligase family protein [Acidobacteria bacterium]|nr:class I tRNA ligase family protein [Acidobacteriota bacterium]
MLVRHLDPETFVHAYNVDLQMLYPWEGVVSPPFGAAWAVLAPGESTKPHAHQECETFFVLRGRGRMAIGAESSVLEPGSVTFHRPFDNHVLTNLSESEDLVFLTVYWEDRGQWSEGETAGEAAAGDAPAVKRVMVTAAPPTPNGDLHLGHLAGPYLSADVHTRFLRLRGVDARFVCGTDDNSIYVKAQGQSMGLGPEAAADHFADAITETLEAAGIDLAVFPRPNASPYHRQLVQEFFSRLYERGELEEREAPAPYCETCESYLFESHIGGRCPYCDGGVVGNTCEDCGRVNDAVNLADATCTACGSKPTTRPYRRLIFPLSRHAAVLREHYRSVSLTPRLHALVESLLADGLPDVAVTHPADWGIEVPLPGYEDQRIYVWLEMAPRYFAYARHLQDLTGPDGGWQDGWRSAFKADDARVVQFFGFDNSFYYAALLPALWKAFDPEIRLPSALVTNEFYRLDGLKFSTSRDHRILGRDLVGQEPLDAVRFFLAHTCPERQETNFTLDTFHALENGELREGWLGWLHDLDRRLEDAQGGEVPATGDWTSEHRRFYHRLQALLGEAQEAYQVPGFSPQRATRTMAELVREARRFAAGERHWRGVSTRGEEQRTAFALELLAAKVLGLMAAPVMPGFAERLWRGLGYAAGPGDGAWTGEVLEWVPAGAVVHLRGDLIPGLG